MGGLLGISTTRRGISVFSDGAAEERGPPGGVEKGVFIVVLGLVSEPVSVPGSTLAEGMGAAAGSAGWNPAAVPPASDGGAGGTGGSGGVGVAGATGGLWRRNILSGPLYLIG